MFDRAPVPVAGAALHRAHGPATPARRPPPRPGRRRVRPHLRRAGRPGPGLRHHGLGLLRHRPGRQGHQLPRGGRDLRVARPTRQGRRRHQQHGRFRLLHGKLERGHRRHLPQPGRLSARRQRRPGRHGRGQPG